MATAFDALLQGADASLQEAFGERFMHRPRRSGAGPYALESADPDRAAEEVSGIFTLSTGHVEKSDAFDQRTDQRPGFNAGGADVEIASTSGVSLQVGDHLERMADGSVWRIVSLRRDDQSRMVCHLRIL